MAIEGNSGSTSYSFVVSRTGDLSLTSTVNWAISAGNGIDGADFVGGVLPSGTVAFAPNESSKTVTVQVAGDTTVETDETFAITLSNPVLCRIGTSTATGTIGNDDTAPPPVTGGGTTPPAYTGNPVQITGADFTLQNYASATSTGLARLGFPIRKGDCPNGARLEIRRNGTAVNAQYDERSTWSDGSLKHTVAHVRDSDFAANESRTYQLWIVPGAFDNTGTKTIADITSNTDFRVDFTNLRETRNWDETGFSTVASGTARASFNTQIGAATRREKHHSGTVCEGWKVWGMVRDTGNNAEDAHLKTTWHVNAWKDGSGAVVAYEVAAVPAQDWWSIPNKRRRRYDATLRNGSTTVASYPNVNHPYHQAWITCQSATGNKSGKRHWIAVSKSEPTLTYKPSKVYWRDTLLVPPLHSTRQPRSYAQEGATDRFAYVPCSSQRHRADIDGTGGYEGRGILPLMDSRAFMLQDPDSIAVARLNAHVGMHIFHQRASNDLRARPGEPSDIANTITSLVLSSTDNKAPAYDFRADGMPAPVHAYCEWRVVGNPESNGFIIHEGGDGVWREGTADTSHAVNHSYYMYLFEGERYHLDALKNSASFTVQRGLANEFSGFVFVMMGYGSYSTYTGCPPDRYWGTIQWQGQERCPAWAMNILGTAAAIVPDNHVERRYIKRLYAQQSCYLAASWPYLPANVEENGNMAYLSWFISPWMQAMTAQCTTFVAAANEDPDMMRYGRWISNGTIKTIKSHIKMLNAYRSHVLPKPEHWWQPGNYFLNERRMANGGVSGAYNPDTGRLTTIDSTMVPIKNGDVVYPIMMVEPMRPGGYLLPIPPEMEQLRPYYMVGVSSSGTGAGQQSFQLAQTPGGAPMTLTVPVNGDNQDVFQPGKRIVALAGVVPTTGMDWNPGDPAYTSLAPDHYETIGAATAIMAKRTGHPAMDNATVNKVTSFINTNCPAIGEWSTWDFEP